MIFFFDTLWPGNYPPHWVITLPAPSTGHNPPMPSQVAVQMCYHLWRGCRVDYRARDHLQCDIPLPEYRMYNANIMSLLLEIILILFT